MKLKLFAIHDSTVKEFIGPEAARTPAEAERKFRVNVNDPQNGYLHSHPEHFTLFMVGEYDSETGKLTPNDPVSIITAVQCKNQPENVTPLKAGT